MCVLQNLCYKYVRDKDILKRLFFNSSGVKHHNFYNWIVFRSVQYVQSTVKWLCPETMAGNCVQVYPKMQYDFCLEVRGIAQPENKIKTKLLHCRWSGLPPRCPSCPRCLLGWTCCSSRGLQAATGRREPQPRCPHTPLSSETVQL